MTCRPEGWVNPHEAHVKMCEAYLYAARQHLNEVVQFSKTATEYYLMRRDSLKQD